MCLAVKARPGAETLTSVPTVEVPLVVVLHRHPRESRARAAPGRAGRLESTALMARITRLHSRVPAEVLVGIALAAVAIPQLFLGPGTDLDVGAVIASGRLITHGDYRPSRP